MSFVNLMANDIWSESDIILRTEAMVRSECSASREFILNRKVSGMVLGQYTMTPDEMLELSNFKALVEFAQQAGNEARADMALLLQTMELESAKKRLAEDPNPDNESDADERAAAQVIVDSASPEVNNLWNLRNPIIEEPVLE